jgi:hypothetical protein
MQPASVSQPTAAEPAGPGCPFDHAAARCPVDHGGRPAAAVRRSRADEFMRALLRIEDRPAPVSDAAVYSSFRRSMFISALRCTLTYVVFPFLLPAASFAAGVGPVIGIAVGSVALTCDVYTIRRFFQVDHRWRWPVAIVALGVMGLLTVLLVQDVAHLLG